MSGMVNPRPYTGVDRQRDLERQQTEQSAPKTMTEKLERLRDNEVGPVKIDEHGKITDGGFGMKMRSGLNAFGLGKPTEDREINQKTLTNVVEQLRLEARQMAIAQNEQWKLEGKDEKKWHINPDEFAKQVVDALKRSTTELYGDSKFLGKTDPGYTIGQRIERGTYLSGALAGQIKFRFDEITRNAIDKTTGNWQLRDDKFHQAQVEAANLRAANFERFNPTNQDSVHRFFGEEVKNDGVISTLVNVGAGIIDGIQSGIDKLTGTETKNTAFERTLQQVREQGIEGHPPSDVKFWDAFEEHWTRAMTAPENSIEGIEFNYLKKNLELEGSKLAREGKILDEKAIGELTAKTITDMKLIGRIGDLRNHNYINGAKVEDIAKAIEVWRDQQPDDVKMQISQNDCEWLAREIVKSDESGRLMKGRAPDLWTELKDMVSGNFSFSEEYDKFGVSPVLGRIYDEIAQNYEKLPQPYFMQQKERTNYYFDKPGSNGGETGHQLDGWREFKNPPAWGPKELAGLFGDSIKEVLIDRHKRIEQQVPELQDNREARDQLHQNLESFPLLKQQAMRYLDHPELLKSNPTTPSGFISAIVTDPIIYARTLAEMQRQIENGQWQSNLPPEPPKPPENAPQHEKDQYVRDKSAYEKLVGAEHERFMLESIRVREINRDILNSSLGKFDVLDEVKETLEHYEKLDLKTLSPQQMEELGRTIDTLRQKGDQMHSFAFFMINDTERGMQVTDQEAKDILGAVTASWCEMEAKLNTLEQQAGRVQFDMRQILDAPGTQGSDLTLRDAEQDLRKTLERTLKALDEDDVKKLGPHSDELKRQLVSAFNLALPMLTEGGEHAPQARGLLELVSKGIRVGMELDRTPQLRDRRELGVEGWNDLVRTSEDQIFSARMQQQLGEVTPGTTPAPMEKPSWMTDSLHRAMTPYPSLQDYVTNNSTGIHTDDEKRRVGGRETIAQLLDVRALYRTKSGMLETVRNDTSIREQDKTRVFNQRIAPLDKIWDEKVVPGLTALENFEPVPPLPETYDRKTIEDYGRTLTAYIERMTKIQEELVFVVSPALMELAGTDDKSPFFGANQAILPTGDIIGQQLALARERLQALN